MVAAIAEELNAPLGEARNTFAAPRQRSRASARRQRPKHRSPCRLYLLPMHASPRNELNAGADRRKLSVGMAATVAAALVGLAVGVGLGLVTRQSSHVAPVALAPAQAAKGPSGGSLPALRATAPLPTLRRDRADTKDAAALPVSEALAASKAVPVSKPPSSTGSPPAGSSPSSILTPSTSAAAPTPQGSGSGSSSDSGGGSGGGGGLHTDEGGSQ
jgi:hypothetical protein